MSKILISSTSFLDTPGAHLSLLEQSGVSYSAARGPLTSTELLKVIHSEGPFVGFLCGEDEFSPEVIQAISGRTKAISKYGVGLDRIDLEGAKQAQIAVRNTPGASDSTVAELTFGLLLALVRNIPEHSQAVHQARWQRITGRELRGKTIGIIGFGRVGREVATRALGFGMSVIVFNTSWSDEQANHVEQANEIFAHPFFGSAKRSIVRALGAEELLARPDVVSLHMNLSRENRSFINARRLALTKRGALIVNVSRAGLVDEKALREALRSGQIGGYAADVLAAEPVDPACPLLGIPRVILTPHIGSRTYESVERQGIAALQNLLAELQLSPAVTNK